MPADRNDLQARIAAATPGLRPAVHHLRCCRSRRRARPRVRPAGTGSRTDFFSHPRSTSRTWPGPPPTAEGALGATDAVHRIGPPILTITSLPCGRTLLTTAWRPAVVLPGAEGYRATVSYGERINDRRRLPTATWCRARLPVPPFRGVVSGARDDGRRIAKAARQTAFLEAEYDFTRECPVSPEAARPDPSARARPRPTSPGTRRPGAVETAREVPLRPRWRRPAPATALPGGDGDSGR
jgi:hypothetical protein